MISQVFQKMDIPCTGRYLYLLPVHVVLPKQVGTITKQSLNSFKDYVHVEPYKFNISCVHILCHTCYVMHIQFSTSFKTNTHELGALTTRRREDGTTAANRRYAKHNAKADNRWVVPYNPAVLLMMGCHINIEICNSVCCVKYMCKYTYKGPDCVTMELSHTEQVSKVAATKAQTCMHSHHVFISEST